MARTTIDFGIDLGTTNSSIALFQGNEVRVFRNNEGFEYTPSAVFIDKNGKQQVGRRAKERLELDSENAYCEFKKSMGKEVDYTFTASGRVMKPYELSAEVLKSLKRDAEQQTGEEVNAAVICVPADFELPQNEATRHAAQLAGIELSPLLQEPVAAALAYGFHMQSEKGFWLVYDLGGGTFDAAVIRVKDGEINVVNHGGDNHLGGKLIDWKIVDELLIPALEEEYKLPDFRRNNAMWGEAMAKLKLAAEKAKISLSRDDEADVRIDFRYGPDRRESVEFEYTLSRANVERITEPFIVRTIHICRQALADKKLKREDIEKLVLVGGPTMMPYLRERLLDPQHGLGIPLEFSMDPLTVVSKGAAIYAGTQQLSAPMIPVDEARDTNAFIAVMTDWSFTGSDKEPTAAGKVMPPNDEVVENFTIEFINAQARPAWRSGKIRLPASGGFLTTLQADKGQVNRFDVELCDATGRIQPVITVPDTLTYSLALSIANAPLTHSLGIGLATNEMEWIVNKGTPLPAKKRTVLRTAREIRQGELSDLLRIPVMEGENAIADRNRHIGTLEVTAKQIKRTLPIGSEVEVTIEIDQSRLIKTQAYIPLLDEEFEEVIRFSREGTRDINILRTEVEQELRRLARVKMQAERQNDESLTLILKQVTDENIEQEITTLLNAIATDPDSYEMCDARMRTLRGLIDNLEAMMRWPVLVSQAEEIITSAKSTIASYGNERDKRDLQAAEAEIRNVIERHSPDMLNQRMRQLNDLMLGILDREGILPALQFERLQEMKTQMNDRDLANKLIAQGLRAIQTSDVQTLRSVNRQLIALLPTATASRAENFSSIIK